MYERPHSLRARHGSDRPQYIDGSLKDEYDLDGTVGSKPVMSVNDLFLLLRYHWTLDTETFPQERQRVGLSLLPLMIIYTSSRPCALIESGCARGSNKALCYRDVRLTIIRNPDEGHRNLLIMEATCLYMKGESEKSNQ